MSDQARQRHGLEAFLAALPEPGGGDCGIEVQILPSPAQVNLRGDPANEIFVATVEAVLGQALPRLANTFSEGRQRVYWLGPDEWLIQVLDIGNSKLVTELEQQLAGHHAAVNEVSGGQVTLCLAGKRVRDVLAKGCTLDLHTDSFPVGSCAQTSLAKAGMLISVLAVPDAFEIIVRRSFAEYVALWLHHSAREYGVRFRAR